MHPRHRPGVRFAAAVAVLSSFASAQCTPAIATGFGRFAIDSPVLVMAAHDDGSGAKLYAGGAFGSQGGTVSRIARLVDGAWQPVGTGLTDGSVRALGVYDDGSGPKLYAGGNFTQIGGVPAFGFARWNGIAWSQVAGGVPGAPLTAGGPGPSVAAMKVFDDGSGPALYLAGRFDSPVFGVAGLLRYRASGLTAVPSASTNCYALEVFDDGSGPALFAGGGNATAGSAWHVLGRWDGAAWTSLGGPFISFSTIRSLRAYDLGDGPALYMGGTFTVQSFKHLARWNGVSWSGLPATYSGSIETVEAFDDGTGPAIFAGGQIAPSFGNFVPSGILRWTASGISPVAGMFAFNVSSLKAFDDGIAPRLYVGYTPADLVGAGSAAFDGAVFRAAETQTTGGVLNTVQAFATHDAGSGPRLYAAGRFHTASAAAVNRVARFESGRWVPVGGGLPLTGYGQPADGIEALASFDSGGGARLYAGGTQLSGTTANPHGISEWNGSSWAPPGGGIPGKVHALAVHDSGSGPALYAGGAFPSAGGSSAIVNLGRWNGTAWSPVALGAAFSPNDRVACLASLSDASGPALFVGGRFAAIGGVSSAGIARWTAAGFASLGPGVTGPAGEPGDVEALAIFDDGSGPAVFAGGTFVIAGGVPVRGIAKWQGGAWSDVGGGVRAQVGGASAGRIDALTVHDDGSGPALYATGLFAQAGAVSALNLARWNGSAWSAVTSGLTLTGATASGQALIRFDDGGGPALFVGGAFDAAGGIVSLNVARYGTSRPTLAVAQPAGPGGAVFVRNAGLLPGHEYFNVFSLQLCGAPGTGPYLGLCAPNPQPLIDQILLPLGFAPFHFLAPATTTNFGPYPLPGGTTADAICLDVTGGAIGCVSTVTRATVN